MLELKNEKNWSWPALSLMSLCWFACLAVFIVSSFFQKEFFNTELLIPLFLSGALGSLLLSIAILYFDFIKKQDPFLWMIYFLNSIVISFILITINWNNSMFFFLYLINIISVGITLKSKGSYLIGLISLIGYNFAVLSSNQDKLYSYMPSILVNNFSLILLSYFSGRLIEYLEVLGIKIESFEKDIRKIKNLNELILSNIPSAVLTVDSNLRLVHWNNKAKNILAERVFTSNDHWLELYKKMNHFLNNKLNSTEFVIEDELKSKKILRSQKAEVNFFDKYDKNNEKVEIFVVEDITQLRQVEENLRNHEKLAAIGKLAAGIAHEIRNPLASISGSVQLLSSQANNDEDKKLFNIVIKETDRLNMLITEFLDYAKPLPPATDPVILVPLINEVLEIIKFNNKLRNDVVVNCSWKAEASILGYKDKLKQAFLNIIINSYQAVEKTQSPLLSLSLEKVEDHLILKIKDNGCGMNDETRKRIFEPFYTTKVKGTGLGLAVTHKILEAHGASIIVESEEGRGTEFVIKIKEYVRMS